MPEWITIRLRNICDSIDYGLTASASPDPVGPRFLRITDIVQPNLNWYNVPFVAAGPRSLERYRLKHGDIVVARTGATTGRSMWIANPPESVFASYLVRFRVSDEFDSRFIGYLLKTPMFLHYVDGVVGGTSAQPNASASTLADAVLRLPRDLTVQRAIAKVLGALDDKIAANERCSAKAASLASLMFQDAVRNDATNTYVGNVAEFHNKLRVPLSSRERANFEGPFPYYGANGVIDHVGGFRFDGHFVLVGEDGTVVRDDGGPVVQFVRGKFWVSNHAHVLKGSSISNEVLLSALNRADVRPYVTGAVQPKLSMGNLKRLQIVVPRDPSGRLDDRLRSLHDLAAQKEAENNELATLRDSLLPRLMSGEVKVRDGEQAVEKRSEVGGLRRSFSALC